MSDQTSRVNQLTASLVQAKGAREAAEAGREAAEQRTASLKAQINQIEEMVMQHAGRDFFVSPKWKQISPSIPLFVRYDT